MVGVILSITFTSCNKDKDPINVTPQPTVTEYKFYKVTGFGNSLKDTVTLYSPTEMYNPWNGQCIIDPRFTLIGTLDTANLRYDYEMVTAPGMQKICGVWHFGTSGASIGNTLFISCQLWQTNNNTLYYTDISTYSRIL